MQMFAQIRKQSAIKIVKLAVALEIVVIAVRRILFAAAVEVMNGAARVTLSVELRRVIV